MADFIKDCIFHADKQHGSKIGNCKLPNANSILSKPIMRSDTAAGKVTIEEVNKQLNDFHFDMIDNSNLSRAHLSGRGFHLNTKGMLKFAKNLIDSIRKL